MSVLGPSNARIQRFTSKSLQLIWTMVNDHKYGKHFQLSVVETSTFQHMSVLNFDNYSSCSPILKPAYSFTGSVLYKNSALTVTSGRLNQPDYLQH